MAIQTLMLMPSLHGLKKSIFSCRQPGLKRIGIWNLAVLIIILAVNIKYDWFYLRIALLALIIGGIGIGTNHLLNFIEYHSPVNAIGAIENYILVFGWIIGWFIENKTIKLQNSL